MSDQPRALRHQHVLSARSGEDLLAHLGVPAFTASRLVGGRPPPEGPPADPPAETLHVAQAAGLRSLTVPRPGTATVARCSRRRGKAMLALMVYGGLRRSEVVRLNVGDYQPQFGLRRVLGKGGHETTVPLPEVARAIVTEYLARERSGAAASEPLFLVQYKWYGGEKKSRRMSGQRVWKIIKDLGKRVGVDTIHPHAFRHACAVELLKRSGGNLRAVQEHLRHADIQTTTIYTRLAPQDLQKVVNLFDERNGGEAR